MDNWLHSASELPPDSFWQDSLFGTQQQLARWLSHDGKDDRRRLHMKTRHGVIWIRRHHTRLCEVFFRFERDYRLAMNRRAEDGQAA